MRQRLKRLIESSLGRLPQRPLGGKDIVLAYHNIVRDHLNVLGDRSLHLRLSDFSRQLEIIQSVGNVVSLTELLSTPPGPIPRIAVTFDDAYLGALEFGVENCRARDLPCTIFVAPALLGKIPYWDVKNAEGAWDNAHREAFLWNEYGDADAQPFSQGLDIGLAACRIATEEELLRYCAHETVTLGIHTMRHINCAAVAPLRLMDELQMSSDWVASRFPSASVAILAYPYGLAPSDIDRRAQVEQSTRFALLVAGGRVPAEGRDDWSIPRWNIPRGLSADGFAARLKGWLPIS